MKTVLYRKAGHKPGFFTRESTPAITPGSRFSSQETAAKAQFASPSCGALDFGCATRSAAVGSGDSKLLFVSRKKSSTSLPQAFAEVADHSDS
jgi:hypothetical protein